MLISRRQLGKQRLKRFHRWLRCVARMAQDSTSGASGAVRRVVSVVQARTRRLDMRPTVGVELPFHQGSERQQQLGGGEENNRRPPECRCTSARMAIEGHTP